MTAVDAPRTGSGRFAPSPTGPLHAGSLVTALACRAAAGRPDGRCGHDGVGGHDGDPFTIRIDDLDTARVVPGAQTAILDALGAHGLCDDATPVARQSDRIDRYEAALHRLAGADRLYRCRCSRRALQSAAVYPGHCRAQRIGTDALAERLRDARHGAPLDDALRVELQGVRTLEDAVQGRRRVRLEQDIGDIIVHRRDGSPAWPLATAVDDARVSRVVRGADLYAPTVAQLALMDLLDLPAPRYAHVPVLVDEHGAKLGKQTHAPALRAADALAALRHAWRFLGQHPIDAGDVTSFVAAACDTFELERVPREASRFDAALAAPAAGTRA